MVTANAFSRLTRVVSRRPAAGLVLALLSGVPAAAQPLPPIPNLPLAALEAPARATIERTLKAVEEKPRDAARNGQLGMLLYANEQYESAAVCFERAHALAPAEARWPYYLAKTQSNLSANEAAAASARAAVRLRPDYLPARLLLAKSLLDTGKTDESRALYERILSDEPRAAEAHYGLGRIEAAAGRPAAAVPHLAKACALSPSFGAAHFALARAYRDLGEKEKAQGELALYEKDRLGWPALPDPYFADILDLKTGALARLQKAVELAEAGQLQSAVEEHEAALAADPTLVQAHNNLIRLYGTLGQPGKAEEHYRAAIALNPALAEIHYNYGVLLAGQKKANEAAEAFRRAIELNPAYAEAHYNYGYLLMTSSRLDEAVEHFRAALANKPDHRDAHFNLGRVYVWQKRLPEAIEQLKQTLAPEDAETPRCTYALGAAYARAGNRDEALRYMTQAREKATALAQFDLVASIDKDLRTLEGQPVSRPAVP
jgi:tetratricopeptide (TPR) repeat protein